MKDALMKALWSGTKVTGYLLISALLTAPVQKAIGEYLGGHIQDPLLTGLINITLVMFLKYMSELPGVSIKVSPVSSSTTTITSTETTFPIPSDLIPPTTVSENQSPELVPTTDNNQTNKSGVDMSAPMNDLVFRVESNSEVTKESKNVDSPVRE
jgi:hypothetical protein